MLRLELGELIATCGGSIKTGPFGTTLKAHEYSAVGVPIISVGEIGYGSFRVHRATPRAPEQVVTRLPEYLLVEGDIVFARKGGVDRSAWVSSEQGGWFLGSDGIRVRLPPDVNSRFVAYQLQLPESRDWLLQHASGSTMPSLNQGILERLPLALPDLDTQCKVVEVLGALDAKIGINNALAATVDAYLDALSERMFANCRDDVRLDEIADVNSEVIKPVAGGSLRYVDIASVGIGRYDYPKLSAWDGAPGRARRRLRRGDTLWSTVRPNRRSHALNLSDDPALVGSTGLAVLRPRDVGFAYLYQVTTRPNFTSYLVSVAEGSAYPAVRAERFAEARVPLARPVDREAFEAIAAPMREHVHSLQVECRELATLRDELLPALMSGDLRVTDAERVDQEVSE